MKTRKLKFTKRTHSGKSEGLGPKSKRQDQQDLQDVRTRFYQTMPMSAVSVVFYTFPRRTDGQSWNGTSDFTKRTQPVWITDFRISDLKLSRRPADRRYSETKPKRNPTRNR